MERESHRMQGQEIRGGFASRIADAMDDQRFTLRTLALAVGTTYEHVRRLVKGEALPSPHLVERIADAVRLPKLELEKLAIEDRAKAKGWTRVVAAAAGKIPALAPIEDAWEHLSEEHQRDLIAIARLFEKEDRHAKVSRSKGT